MSDLFDHKATSGARFSPCGAYRYTLWRKWEPREKSLCFVMLNPSTADAEKNDPTVERCERRARQLGFGGLLVVNLFALRSTDPAALYTHVDPVGPENDNIIRAAAQLGGQVVCGWGGHGRLRDRGTHVLAAIRSVGVTPYALEFNSDGTPRHPLYVSYDIVPRVMRETEPGWIAWANNCGRDLA